MSTPASLRCWRWPKGLRHPLVGALMPLSVLSGVVGQSLLSGFTSFFVLCASAILLMGLAAYLFVDFQGELILRPEGLALPGGDAVPRARLAGARAEAGPGGGVLVLLLTGPAEERRVPTGQDLARVQAFAEAIPAIASTPGAA